MIKTTLVCLLLTTLTLAANFGGPVYEAQARKEKLSQLWSKITSNTQSGAYPAGASAAGLFLESMKTSFEHVADTFPDGRIKYIHSVGVVAQVKFEATQNTPYTGVFKGADSVLLRLSLAKNPDTSKTTAAGAQDNFTPGLGIKLLRDDVDSANTVAMYGVNGFDSWNFFERDASNHIGAASGAALTAVAAKFKTATDYIQTVGLSGWADHDQEGAEVQNPKFPFKIVFQGTDSVKSMYGSDYSGELWTDSLKKIKAGTHLYDVYAVDTPFDNCQKVLIGKIVTSTDFTTSKFGDENLFFRHGYMQDDFKLQPSWEQYTPYVNWLIKSKVEKTTKCPFFNPGS